MIGIAVDTAHQGTAMTRCVETSSTGDGSEPTRRIHYSGWLWLVFCWDGVLPMCVLVVPQLALKFGADRGTSELLAILTPVVAFFVRLAIGIRRLARNHCGQILRSFQFAVFFLAAVLLVCIDSLMILSMEMNGGQLWANQGDMIVMAGLLAIYFAAMLFAFYPGRTVEPSRETDSDPDEWRPDWNHDSTTHSCRWLDD